MTLQTERRNELVALFQLSGWIEDCLGDWIDRGGLDYFGEDAQFVLVFEGQDELEHGFELVLAELFELGYEQMGILICDGLQDADNSEYNLFFVGQFIRLRIIVAIIKTNPHQ